MYLERISLQNFRNYSHLNVDFSPGLNVIYGENAQGKTNLLEGICYLSALRSFRSTTLKDVVQIGQEAAEISGDLQDRSLHKSLEVSLKAGSKQYKVGGVVAKTSKEYATHIRSVSFTSDDLRLISGSPSRRRRFMDQAISTVTPDYLSVIADYSRTVQQKSQLLNGPGLVDRALLEVWNLRLAASGARVMAARGRYLDYIRPEFEKAFTSISHSAVQADLRYISEIDCTSWTISELEASLNQRLDRDLEEERRRKRCLVGPHRDDMSIALDGFPASKHGSQGQMRMLSVALKLCEITSVIDKAELLPLFLLDDVSSELDMERNRRLFDTLKACGCQVFVTTTALRNINVENWEQVRQIQISQGCIV